MKNKNNKSNLLTFVYILIGLAAGAFFGYIINDVWSNGEDVPFYLFFFRFVILMIFLILSIYVQAMFHEGGHLVFGLMSGYKFCSYRVGNIMLIRKDGKLMFKRMSLPGTLGQCLMGPPDMKDGAVPVMLYNFGGVIMNIIVSIISLVIYFLVRDIWQYASIFFIINAFVGIWFALINGIPFKTAATNNDGKNAFETQKDPEAMKAFWLQMKIAEASSNGLRIKDIPEEWFEEPREEKMNNSLIVSLAVIRENRLMDLHEFEQASLLSDKLLSQENAILGIHKSLLIMDAAFCELIGKSDTSYSEKLKEKNQILFIRQMKDFPSVIRTQYAYALLGEHDTGKADKYLEHLNEVSKKHPYEGDIQTERELINIAKEYASSLKIQQTGT
jgi:hypothetical protein